MSNIDNNFYLFYHTLNVKNSCNKICEFTQFPPINHNQILWVIQIAVLHPVWITVFRAERGKNNVCLFEKILVIVDLHRRVPPILCIQCPYHDAPIPRP
jgi:hypothetical protein